MASDLSTSHLTQVSPTSLGGDEVGLANGRLLGGRQGVSSWFDTWRLALRRWLSSPADAPSADLDAVAQEVYARLMRYSDQTLAEYPQSYLFRIATNVVDEWHARDEDGPSRQGAWLELLGHEPDEAAASGSSHKQVDEQVRAAVARLPSRQRDVLLLHINDNLTYGEIATKLNLSPRAVRRDLARAYSCLRWELRVVELDVISS